MSLVNFLSTVSAGQFIPFLMSILCFVIAFFLLFKKQVKHSLRIVFGVLLLFLWLFYALVLLSLISVAPILSFFLISFIVLIFFLFIGIRLLLRKDLSKKLRIIFIVFLFLIAIIHLLPFFFYMFLRIGLY